MQARPPLEPAPKARLGRAALQLGSVVVFTVGVALILWAAGSTRGYDFQAYVRAGARLLHSDRLYDPAVDVAGGFAIFLYPPPFAVAMVPFALLPSDIGPWAWTALLIAAFLLGVAILPVRSDVRWTLLLLAGLSWPFLYTVKLGQVTPVLFLAFAVGWRGIERPLALGLAMAVGTLVKLQPALLFAWAVATGRWRAVAIGIAALAAAAAAATLVTGPSAWSDYVALLERVSAPVTTPHLYTIGALAYQSGLSETAAIALQWLWMGVAVALSLFAWFRRDGETGYLVTVVASQMLSPLLWDHYAMLLMLPVALLLERRRWWAVAIPLVTWLPAWAYPVAFLAAGIGLIIAGPALNGARRAGSIAGDPVGAPPIP